MTVIIGAGLAGAMAGVLEPGARVYEAGDGKARHSAVLRFREPKIGRALGIPFKEVRVYKAVFWHGRSYTAVTPEQMNWYSRKVTGGISPRSIVDLSPVNRFVAPPDLHDRMLAALGSRLYLASPINRITRTTFCVDGVSQQRGGEPMISTAPLRNILSMLEPEMTIAAEFKFAGINVARYRVPNCDVHQTIYFPAPDTSVYRGTLTGDNLIVESTAGEARLSDWTMVLEAFGLRGIVCQPAGTHSQRFGKIVPIDPDLRKQTLFNITTQYGLYSLGRFACWRNLLLDDVFEDLFKVRAMINMTNQYDLVRSIVNES